MNGLGYDNAFSEVSLYTTHRVVTVAHKIDSCSNMLSWLLLPGGEVK